MRQRDPKTGHFLPDPPYHRNPVVKPLDPVHEILTKIHATQLPQTGLSVFDAALGVTLGNALFSLVVLGEIWVFVNLDKIKTCVGL